MITLSERMRSALLESGKTPAELARACDVRPPSVSAWLSGETKSLKAKSAHAAARFLGVSASWLSDGIGPRYPEGLRPAAAAIEGGAAVHPPVVPDEAPSITALLDALREQIATQPDAVKRALAELVSEYVSTPDEQTGKKVAEAIVRMLGAER